MKHFSTRRAIEILDFLGTEINLHSFHLNAYLLFFLTDFVYVSVSHDIIIIQTCKKKKKKDTIEEKMNTLFNTYHKALNKILLYIFTYIKSKIKEKV